MRDRSELGKVTSSMEIGFSMDGALLAVALRESTGRTTPEDSAAMKTAAEDLENLFLLTKEKRGSFKYISYLEAPQGDWVTAVAECAPPSDSQRPKSDNAIVEQWVRQASSALKALADNKEVAEERLTATKTLLSMISQLTLGYVDHIQHESPVEEGTWQRIAAHQ